MNEDNRENDIENKREPLGSEKEEIGFIKKVNTVFLNIENIQKNVELFSSEAIAILDKVSRDDIVELKALSFCLDELKDIYNNLNFILQSKEFVKDMAAYEVFVEQKLELMSAKEKLVCDLSTNVEQTYQLVEAKKDELISIIYSVVQNTKATLNLQNVDNTSDLDKPISTATQDELDKKVDKTITINNKALNENIILAKEDIGLGNVNNTADNEKVVKSATKWETPRNLTIGSTTKLVDGSNDIAFNLEEIVEGIKNTALKKIHGWFKDSSTGIIFQWGETGGMYAYSQDFSFPIAFPNRALNIFFGFRDGEGIPRGDVISRTQYRVRPAYNISTAFHFLAIGY